ncbi:MAG: hypothetical protein J5I92_09495 [Thiogranum sp.]|nr:hypothetical protein [Thiogranum sp.]
MTAHPARQRGAVTLIGALFIIITLALMIEVLHRSAGSDILDTAAQGNSVQALFLAESGLEHAAARLGSGTCDASLTGTYPFGNGSFTIEDLGPGFVTDFSGTALPATDCRIRVTATLPVTGAQRVIEATFRKDGNLLAGANASFDEPSGPCVAPGCYPAGWSLPDNGWDDTGGAGTPVNRAAYVIKPNPGGSTATTAGAFGLTPFTVTAPITLTLNLDVRVVTSGATNKEAQLSFSLTDGTNTYNAAPYPLELGHTGSYTADAVTFTIGGTGPVTITGLDFILFAKAGQPKQIWLDNLDLQGPGGGGTISLLQWREVISN